MSTKSLRISAVKKRIRPESLRTSFFPSLIYNQKYRKSLNELSSETLKLRTHVLTFSNDKIPSVLYYGKTSYNPKCRKKEASLLFSKLKQKYSRFLFTEAGKTNVFPGFLGYSKFSHCPKTVRVLGSTDLDNSRIFLNLAFNKGVLKNFVFWCFVNYGQAKTIKILEKLQRIGFSYATKAGISLSIDDLKIPPIKAMLLTEAEKSVEAGLLGYKKAQLTGLERFQRIIETWHKTSESLKDEMIEHFRKTDTLNPVYMMAFSGARGNVSQVRQLVSMRGLMSDPQGKILSFPIQSNFREGLTLTEYVISCYGARKGVVDTALRTANAGYLTRRLVDVAQHVIVLNFDCGTKKGFYLTEMTALNKTLYPLGQRLIGRVLAADIYNIKPSLHKKMRKTESNLEQFGCKGEVVARRNEEISEPLAQKIAKLTNKVFIRSPLTCATPRLVCQLCYGWSLSEGYLVSIGEAVGIIAAQSIGEPGTQLTMRTFHTGGVFSGEMFDQLIAPYDAIITYSAAVPGTLIRTTQGKIAFLIKGEGQLSICKCDDTGSISEKKSFKLPPYTVLFIRNNEKVLKDQLIAELAFLSSKIARKSETAEFIIKSEIEGQIYNGSINIVEKFSNYNDMITQSKDWGTIWLLSGKICQLPLNSAFFALPGDLVDETSVLSEVKWFVPVKTLLDTNSVIKPIKKERYYDFSLNKQKWSYQRKVQNLTTRSPLLPTQIFPKKTIRTEQKSQIFLPGKTSVLTKSNNQSYLSFSKKFINLNNPINNKSSLIVKLRMQLNDVQKHKYSLNKNSNEFSENFLESKISDFRGQKVSPVPAKRVWVQFSSEKLCGPNQTYQNKVSQVDQNIQNFFSIKNKTNISLPVILINVDKISYKNFGYFFSFFQEKLASKNTLEDKRAVFGHWEQFRFYFTQANFTCPKKLASKNRDDFWVRDVFFVPKLLEQRTNFWQKNYSPQEIATEKDGYFISSEPPDTRGSSSPTLNIRYQNRLSKDLFQWFPKRYLSLKAGICMYSFNYDSLTHYSNFIYSINSFKTKNLNSFKSKILAKILLVNQYSSNTKIYTVKVRHKTQFTLQNPKTQKIEPEYKLSHNQKSQQCLPVPDWVLGFRFKENNSFPSSRFWQVPGSFPRTQLGWSLVNKNRVKNSALFFHPTEKTNFFSSIKSTSFEESYLYKNCQASSQEFDQKFHMSSSNSAFSTRIFGSPLSTRIFKSFLRGFFQQPKHLGSSFFNRSRVLSLTPFPFRLGILERLSLSLYPTLKSFCFKDKSSPYELGGWKNLRFSKTQNSVQKGSQRTVIRDSVFSIKGNRFFGNQKSEILDFSFQKSGRFLLSTAYGFELPKNVFIYKPKNFVSAISLHKKIIFPGQKLVDDLSFDRCLVYVQCLPESYLLETNKFQTNQLLKKSSEFLFKSDWVKSISQNKALEINFPNLKVKFCGKKYIYNKSSRFQSRTSESLTFLCKLKQGRNHKKWGFRHPASQNPESNFILLISKIREYPVYQKNHYKKILYQSQSTNSFKFKSKVCNKIAKSNYHSQLLNKQYRSLRLLEKFPKIDLVLDISYKGLKNSIMQKLTNNLINFNFYRKLELLKKFKFGYFPLKQIKFVENRAALFLLNSRNNNFNRLLQLTGDKDRIPQLLPAEGKNSETDFLQDFASGMLIFSFFHKNPRKTKRSLIRRKSTFGGFNTGKKTSFFKADTKIFPIVGKEASSKTKKSFEFYSNIFDRNRFLTSSNIEFLTKSSIQFLTIIVSARQKRWENRVASYPGKNIPDFFQVPGSLKICSKKVFKYNSVQHNLLKGVSEKSQMSNMLGVISKSKRVILSSSPVVVKKNMESFWSGMQLRIVNELKRTSNYSLEITSNYSTKSLVTLISYQANNGKVWKITKRNHIPVKRSRFYLWNQRLSIVISKLNKISFQQTAKRTEPSFPKNNLNNVVKNNASDQKDSFLSGLETQFFSGFNPNLNLDKNIPDWSNNSLGFSDYMSSEKLDLNPIIDKLERAFAASDSQVTDSYRTISSQNGNGTGRDQLSTQPYLSTNIPVNNNSNERQDFWISFDQSTDNMSLENKKTEYYKKHFLKSFSFFNFLDKKIKKLSSENNRSQESQLELRIGNSNLSSGFIGKLAGTRQNRVLPGENISFAKNQDGRFSRSLAGFTQTPVSLEPPVDVNSLWTLSPRKFRIIESKNRTRSWQTLRLASSKVFLKPIFGGWVLGSRKPSEKRRTYLYEVGISQSFLFFPKVMRKFIYSKPLPFRPELYQSTNFSKSAMNELSIPNLDNVDFPQIFDFFKIQLIWYLSPKRKSFKENNLNQYAKNPYIENNFNSLFDQYLPRTKRTTVYSFEHLKINPNNMSKVSWEPNCYFNYDQKSHFPYFSKSNLRNSYFIRLPSTDIPASSLNGSNTSRIRQGINSNYLRPGNFTATGELQGGNFSLAKLRQNFKKIKNYNLFSQFLSIFNKSSVYTNKKSWWNPESSLCFWPVQSVQKESIENLTEFVFPSNNDFSFLAGFFQQPCLYAFFSSQVAFGYNELMVENPYLKLSKKGLKTRMAFKSNSWVPGQTLGSTEVLGSTMGFGKGQSLPGKDFSSGDSSELALTSYLSPFKGEILRHETFYWSQNSQRNRYLFLTKTDQISFYSINYFNQKRQNSLHKNFFKTNNIDLKKWNQQKKVGQFVNKGDYLKLNSENVIISSESGILIHYNKFKVTLRKAQSFFLSPNCIFYYAHGDLVEKNQSILSLPYQQLKTGDIVQGIPKVEQLLEARSTFKGKEEEDNLHTLLIYVFELYKKKFSLKLSVRKSFSFIQLILVNSVQRIYRSQGVNISDKHLEVIVKQMTSKVQITSRGDSSFFRGEYVDLYIVESWNSLHPQLKKICYKPILLGISRSSLEVNSFLSAASFQHTKKVLSRSAFKTNIDFLNGLKENVIIGNLISAGTGNLTTNSLKH